MKNNKSIKLFFLIFILTCLFKSCAWYLYPKAILEDMREMEVRRKKTVYNLSFSGIVVDKGIYGANCWITILLKQIHPSFTELTLTDRFELERFGIQECDSTNKSYEVCYPCNCTPPNPCYIKISIPEAAYNQIEKKQPITKEPSSYYFLTNGKKILWIKP